MAPERDEPKRWTDAHLREELIRYEQECIAAGCAPITVLSYVRYATMFVDWRVAASHTTGAPGPNHARTYAATVEDLLADVRAYALDLESAGLSPRAVSTYSTIHGGQFVRWLDGRFRPCAGMATRSDNRPNGEALHGGRDSVPKQPPADLAWAREESVQAKVVAWLEGAGWVIERAADTQSHEHGPDIIATTGDRRLAIEVKGYPQATYETGAKAGEPKRWHPAAQARTYFGNAVHTGLVMRDSMPGV